MGLFAAVLASGVSLVAAEPPALSPTVQQETATPAGAEEIQEWGLPKGDPGKGKKGAGSLPAKLCQEVTLIMRPQCRCANAHRLSGPVDALSYLMSRGQSELSVLPLIPRHAVSTASESVRDGAADGHAVLL